MREWQHRYKECLLSRESAGFLCRMSWLVGASLADGILLYIFVKFIQMA